MSKEDKTPPPPPPPPSPPSLPSSPQSQPSTRTMEGSLPPSGNYELRLYGLNPAVTTDDLVSFFSTKNRVLGVLLHPQQGALSWAQLWVSSEEELQRCLGLKRHFAPSGITISQAPKATPAPIAMNQGLLTPELSVDSLAIDLRAPLTPPSLSRGVRSDSAALSYRHVDPHGPLPRNLYVMGLPLDLTQLQFKNLFSQYGMVEHSTLLSQLDGMGRRRGFILMSTHREALEAMQMMNGRHIDNNRIDVSWALVQRESKNIGSNSFGALPNRVIHPPSIPTRREPPEECSVIVENLNPFYFPNAGAVREIFSTFGPVARVSIMSTDPFHALVQFGHEISATALINANGLSIGGRQVLTRPYVKSTMPTLTSSRESSSSRLTFDPFGPSEPISQRLSRLNIQHRASGNGTLTPTSLSALSEPFVPLPSSALWLSQSTDSRHASSSSSQVRIESPNTDNDTPPSNGSLSNSHSDSTKGANSDQTSGKATIRESCDDTSSEPQASQNMNNSWPAISSSTSRWASAPNFCELLLIC